MPIDVVPVTPQRWEELAEFFGPSGAYSGCWCTWWRQTQADFDQGCTNKAAGNRTLLRRLTASEQVPGLLAYDGGKPLGWVSVAPRPQFGRVLRSPQLKPSGQDDPEDASIWSVVCFWVPRAHRGRGVGTALLDAAVRHAGSGGARVVEGYPVDVAGKAPADQIFTGTVAMFRRAGFRQVRGRPASGKRLVVRRAP